jgi:Periplasmic binding protein
MSQRSLVPLAVLTAALLAVVGAVPLQAAQDIVIGLQCDRTGPTQVVGVVLCPGYHDYVDLVNSKGGVAGHMIRVDEIDHEYKVPPAVEAYERYKAEGAVMVALYGTPQTYALTEKLTEDRIPGTSPGFGRADAADGTRYPYIFPIAATYWSQATAAVHFVKGQLKDLHARVDLRFEQTAAGRVSTAWKVRHDQLDVERIDEARLLDRCQQMSYPASKGSRIHVNRSPVPSLVGRQGGAPSEGASRVNVPETCRRRL